MVHRTPEYHPTLVKGLTIYPDNPLQFDFIVEKGHENLNGLELQQESMKMIKYFLASLTVPEHDMWVNLSPYEKGRIIPEGFGITEMGRDLLAQDYMLKQLTASLMYPEDELGEKFWKTVYDKAYQRYGTTEIPVNTFNKVWIVPDKAVVFEHENSAFVVERHLKVMLEQDYMALASNRDNKKFGMDDLAQRDREEISDASSEVVREILIPEIEEEINTGKNFANLRQIYNAMILATWFKQNLKESLLGQVYVDKNKVKGVDVEDKEVSQKIYEQYITAFRKGVYNYIREDLDPATQEMIPRKYFSGGALGVRKVVEIEDGAMLSFEQSGELPEADSSVRVTFGAWDLGGKGDSEAAKAASQQAFVAQDGDDQSLLVSNNIVLKPLSVIKEGIKAVRKGGGTILTLGFLSLAALNGPAEAVFPETAELFTLDSLKYDVVKALTQEEAGPLLDMNLTEMLRDYQQANGGTLTTPQLQLRLLSPILTKTVQSNPNPTFEHVARDLRREFSTRYRKFKEGKLTQSEKQNLAQLEYEASRWLMDFLMSSAEYDKYLDKEGNFMALYRTFIGNEKYPANERTYVCKTASEALVVLGVREMGMRAMALTVVPVLEDFDGNTFPGKDGAGHEAVLLKPVTGPRIMFDQRNEMLSTSPVNQQHHKFLVWDENGRSYTVNLPGLKKGHSNLNGETFDQLLENQRIYAEIMEIGDELEQLVNVEKLTSKKPSAAHTKLNDLARRLDSISLSKAYKRQEEIRVNVEIIAKGLRKQLGVVRYNKQIDADGNIIEEYNRVVRELAGKLRKAQKLFNAGKRSQAKALYTEIEKEVSEAIDEFSGRLSGVNGLSADGTNRPVSSRDFIKQLEEMKQIASHNANTASGKNKVQIRPKSNTGTPLAKYQDAVGRLQDSMREAQREFNEGISNSKAGDYEQAANNFKEAERRFRVVKGQSNGEVNQLEGPLKGITGIVDQRGNKLTGGDLINTIRELQKTAEENRKTAENNFYFNKYKQIETRYNAVARMGRNRSKQLTELKSIKAEVDRLFPKVKNPQIKGFYNKLSRGAEKAIRSLGDVSALPPTTGEGKDVALVGSEKNIDQMTVTQLNDPVGGIDLNPELLDLQIKRDGKGVPLPLPQQPIENMHIEGFFPVIINITPATNLPLIFGKANEEEKDSQVPPGDVHPSIVRGKKS